MTLSDTLLVISTAATALATGAVAYFTWAIRRVHDKQWKHAREVDQAYISAGGARKTRQADVFEFHVNNYGRTQGTVYKIGIGFCEQSDIPPTPRYEFTYRRNPLPPGCRALRLFEFSVRADLRVTVVYGRVYYETIFGDCYSSGFIYRIMKGEDPIPIRPPSDDYIQERAERCETIERSRA